MTKKTGEPPVIGKCGFCKTKFHSRYALKTHACKKGQAAEHG